MRDINVSNTKEQGIREKMNTKEIQKKYESKENLSMKGGMGSEWILLPPVTPL